MAQWRCGRRRALVRFPDGHDLRPEPDRQHQHEQPVRRPRRPPEAAESRSTRKRCRRRSSSPASPLALYPDVIKQIMASGRHEIGVHRLDPREQRRRLAPTRNSAASSPRPIAALEAATGQQAGRLPLAVLGLQRRHAHDPAPRQRLSLRQRHDGRRRAVRDPRRAGKPHRPARDPRRVDARRRDVLPAAEPAEPRRRSSRCWRAEFDQAYEERGLFQVTMHPRPLGAPLARRRCSTS